MSLLHPQTTQNTNDAITYTQTITFNLEQGGNIFCSFNSYKNYFIVMDSNSEPTFLNEYLLF